MNDYLSNMSFSIDYPDYDQKYGKLLLHHKINFNTDPLLDSIQKDIIKTNNPSFAAFFAYEIPYHSYRMQEIILNSKSLPHILFFAQNINGSDIKALQQAIIISSSKDRFKYLFQFAYSIPTADIKKIELIIIEAAENNPKLIRISYHFFRYIRCSNPNRFIKAILKYGIPSQWFYLAEKSQSRKEVALIEKKLMEANSFRYIRLVAQNIPLANIQRLEKWVLASGNIVEIKKFAKAVKLSKVRHLAILF